MEKIKKRKSKKRTKQAMVMGFLNSLMKMNAKKFKKDQKKCNVNCTVCFFVHDTADHRIKMYVYKPKIVFVFTY